MRRGWAWAPLFVACQGAVDDAVDDAVDSAAPAADGVAWPAAPATWGPDDVPAGIEAALGDGVADPWGTVAAWVGFFDHADGSCPAGTAFDLPVDYAGCETSDGWHFAGTGFLERFDNPDDVGFSLSNDCEVLAPDGTRYVGAGTWGVSVPREAGPFSVKASGLFAWPSAEGPLGAGYSVWFTQSGELTQDGGRFSLHGTSAVGDAAVSFERVQVDTATCPGGTGTIGLRDPSGGWHALVLDAACDGCGTVSYDGVETGRACVDLAPRWAASLAALRPTDVPW